MPKKKKIGTVMNPNGPVGIHGDFRLAEFVVCCVRGKLPSEVASEYDADCVTVAYFVMVYFCHLHRTAIIQLQSLSILGHIARIDDDADAKVILTAPPADNWKRPPRRPRITPSAACQKRRRKDECHGHVQTCRPMGACIACLVISVGGVCGRCWS